MKKGAGPLIFIDIRLNYDDFMSCFRLILVSLLITFQFFLRFETARFCHIWVVALLLKLETAGFCHI